MLKSRAYRISFIGLSLLFGLYLSARAFLNPLVFDEAISYFLFIKNGSFLPGDAFWSANNHLLNSALAYFSTRIFGLSEWSLRLPNLLAFPLYAFFGFRLIRNFSSPLLRWWSLVLFFTLHGILEYFAYARGYGLLLSFLMAALWHWLRVYQTGTRKPFLWLISFSFLSLLSNVSALPLVSLLLVSGAYFHGKGETQRSFKIALIALSLLPMAYALWWSFSLKSHHQLYYGGEVGFIQDSLESLKNMVLGPSLSLDLLLAGAALFLIAFITSKPWQMKNFSAAHALAVGFITITLFYPISHWLIGLKFPFDRALIYWLLFGLSAFFALLDWHYKHGVKSFVFFALWTLAFPLTFSAKVSLNRASFESWSKEQVPESFYQKLAAQKAQNFGGSYLQAPQWSFWQQKLKGNLANFQVSDSPWLDYRLCESKELNTWLNDYYELENNGSGLHLLQRKQISRKEALGTFTAPSLERHREGQPILEGALDGRYQAISGQMKIKVEEPHKLAIAFQALSEDGEQVYWQAYRAREYLSSQKDWQDWRLFVVLKDLPEASQMLKVFIWNPENEEFSIQESEWTVWELN